jgi:hypothetical protein
LYSSAGQRISKYFVEKKIFYSPLNLKKKCREDNCTVEGAFAGGQQHHAQHIDSFL